MAVTANPIRGNKDQKRMPLGPAATLSTPGDTALKERSLARYLVTFLLDN